MAGVILEDICKSFDNGKTNVVDRINLSIEDREFLVLVGPSGCGKSTTLRMIAGLEEISSGNLYIGDRQVNDVPPKSRDIAMVFQNYALYPHMTVRKNLAFGLKLRKMPKDEIAERVAAAAEILGLGDLLERRPKELSGGQRQRVAVGRAIVRQPRVFLFDEPLSNLDAKLRVQMRTEISRLHLRLRTTMVYVTHDQAEAMTMGTRIAVMNDGIIQQIDTPLRIYQKPANLFVAGFIGSPAMNISAADICNGNGAPALNIDNVTVPLSAESRTALANAGSITTVTVGVRPEDIDFAAPDDPAALPCECELVEQMGAETIAYFKTSGGRKLTTRSKTCPVSIGESARLRLPEGHIHLFHPQTRDALV